MLKEYGEDKTCSIDVVHNFYIRTNVYIKCIYKGKAVKYDMQKRHDLSFANKW